MIWQLIQAILSHNVEFNVPFEASSKDVKVLLESLIGLLISIRFSGLSPDDIRGYRETCTVIFEGTGNQRGKFIFAPQASNRLDRSIIIAEEI